MGIDEGMNRGIEGRVILTEGSENSGGILFCWISRESKLLAVNNTLELKLAGVVYNIIPKASPL
jgi:hypothetical protein